MKDSLSGMIKSLPEPTAPRPAAVSDAAASAQLSDLELAVLRRRHILREKRELVAASLGISVPHCLKIEEAVLGRLEQLGKTGPAE